MKQLTIIFSLFFITQSFKIEKIFYGNNNYHLPCVIVKIENELDDIKIKELINELHIKLPKQKGKIRTLLKHKDKPYAIVYSDKYKKDIIINHFDSIQKEYKEIANRFLSIQKSTELQNHKIYGFFFNLGSCYKLNFKHPSSIDIISIDTLNNYHHSNFSSKIYRKKPLTKINEGFELETTIFNSSSKPPTKSKQIFYKTENDNLVVKDLEYINIQDEKYIYFLHRINIKND